MSWAMPSPGGWRRSSGQMADRCSTTVHRTPSCPLLPFEHRTHMACAPDIFGMCTGHPGCPDNKEQGTSKNGNADCFVDITYIGAMTGRIATRHELWLAQPPSHRRQRNGLGRARDQAEKVQTIFRGATRAGTSSRDVLLAPEFFAPASAADIGRRKPHKTRHCLQRQRKWYGKDRSTCAE